MNQLILNIQVTEMNQNQGLEDSKNGLMVNLKPIK